MEDTYRFASFRLETRSLTLWHGDRRLDVTPKMVETLLVLIRRPGEFVDKTTLLREAWPGVHVAESGLTRNISVLRKALHQAAPGCEFIETLPRRGYRFIDAAKTRRQPPAPNLAWSIAGALALLLLSLSPPQNQRRDSSPERESLLIAEALSQKSSPAAARQSERWFSRALALDPNSAQARAGMAGAQLQLMSFGVQRGAREQALAEARRAVALAPSSANARTVFALATLANDFDWLAAEDHLSHALALDRGNLNTLLAFAHFRVRQSRFREAAALLLHARAIDPASQRVAVEGAKLAYYEGNPARAAHLLEALVEREPEFGLAHYFLGLSYGYLGRFNDARRHLTASALNDHLLRHDLAWISSRAGDPRPAILFQNTAPRPSAILDLELGNLDRAAALTDRMIAERRPEALGVLSDPRFARLRESAHWPSLRDRVLGATRLSRSESATTPAPL